MKRVTLSLLLVASAINVYADTNLVTWNAREIFSVDAVETRKDDFKRLYKSLDPDVLMIQEITSCDELTEIAKVVGLNDFHVACSDFNLDGNKYASFEVGVISRLPLGWVYELDPIPDQNKEVPDLQELRLTPPPSVINSKKTGSRGALVFEIPSLKLVGAVVHLKSSRGYVGEKDSANAEKREAIVSGTGEQLLAYLKTHSILIAGDFNVGHSDQAKNGSSTKNDCYSNCQGKDLYDETHALLSEGIIPGLAMKNLVLNRSETTYPRYPGSPIDNIYLQGDLIKNTSMSIVGDETFGSDHLPVKVVIND